MLFKICLIGCLALIACADNSLDFQDDDAFKPVHTRVEHSVSFETSHKRPSDPFETSHKVSYLNPKRDAESDFADLMQLQETTNLLPTKERPELNPILSALINEDVMKSIEAKRAIEQKELDIIRAEVEEAVQEEEAVLAAAAEQQAAQTEAPPVVLTTVAPLEKKLYDDDINVGFVDQTIHLDTAGSEANKKTRIEIKKGPNGQDYEYEYVYYYEEDEEEDKKEPAVAAAVATSTTVTADKEARGKSRYTNIERNNAAAPADNALVTGMAKGRSSSVNSAENVEPERLPVNTRFPTRGKNVDVPPTPPLDSLENAAEKKKISVKRPSLELVDSDTFNTDEKNAKSSRNGDAEATKPAHAIEQEQAAAAAAVDAANAAANADAAAVAPTVAESAAPQEGASASNSESATQGTEEESTTPSMQKAALDLYAILTNENLNMDMTTDVDAAGTTAMPGDEEMLTTVAEEEPSSTSTTTTTTTTTTTPAPTTTTTTTTTTSTTPASLFGGRRPGLAAAGRNRYKSKTGGATTTTTTEAPAAAEQAPKGKNRFSRPSIGGRGRIPPKTTAAPEAPATGEEQEVVEKKDVKPVSSGFGRGRPRNRFNLRGSTTEKPAEAGGEEAAHEDSSVSTTARSLRARPTLNLRGRSRVTTTKAPASAEGTANGEGGDAAASAAAEDKPAAPAAAAGRPSRFNINRPGGNRLLPRTKLGRTTEAPAAAAADADSTVEGSQHNDVKESSGEENAVAAADKTETEAHPASHPIGGLNRLKSRPRLNTIQKTESPKPKPTPIAPRKVNPLLAKRRLQLGPSTTEAPAAEADHDDSAEEADSKEDAGAAAPHDAAADNSEENATEAVESTTKAQARGLGLLGQRRRLPLRKPGTIL